MKIHFLRLLFLVAVILSAFSFTVVAQQPIKKYEKEWKKVEAFIEKGLPKSALAEVKKIYELAKKEKQDAQIIKALVYSMDLQGENREDNEIFSIKELEKEITAAKEPVSSILNSLLASMYWQYYQQNRWKLYSRTETVDFVKTDIATWSTEDFHKRISELYLLSIRNESLLQQTRLEPFDAIITKGTVRHLRPTLFDLLAHRAIDYFENDERDIRKPAYAFELDQESVFSPAADFANQKFTTRDSLSLKFKALTLYQRLITFHLKDGKPDALIDVDILRLDFARINSIHPDKDKLYFDAISQLANRYRDLPAASKAWFLMAAYFEQKASSYKPYGDSTYRLYRLQAKEILEKILTQKDSSEGRTLAYNLLLSIKRPSLQFNIEKVNSPLMPFRALVEYKNFNQAYIRVVRATDALKKELESQYGDKYWGPVLAAKPVKEWQQSLPGSEDMQSHRAEVKIDGLPEGEYLLIVSSAKDFNSNKSLVGARLFYVSHISYVNSNQDFFVLDRDKGGPLANARVQVWEQQYDYNLGKYVKTKGKNYSTNSNGYFRMQSIKQNESKRYTNYTYSLEITHGGENFFMSDMLYDYYYYNGEPEEEEPEISTSIFLFNDRSIYRPGQTIYFKGIVLMYDPAIKKRSIREDYTTKLYLRDANYKDIDSLTIKTNEFGSFSGKFQLPQSGLNGQFTIYTKVDPSSSVFRVEEYKRPKFYVEYEPIKGTYKVNDKVAVTGIAKAYAGNNIDGALVKYRVVRQPRYLYPWMFRRWWQPPAEPMEITHGEVKTDKDGRFKIEFTAIPDQKIDKKFEPVFDYIVYADVTDINGETRSGEKTVTVGYKSLILRVNLPSTLPSDSLRSMNIRTENMNGEFEPAIVNVLIRSLKQEDRLIRDRFWERPDQFVMSKEEYIKNFPYDEYDNEKDPTTWEKMSIVFDRSDSVTKEGNWRMSGPALIPGYYMVEISTKDKNGEIVKDIKYIELYDEKSRQLVLPEYLWTEGAKPIEPGEKTKVKIATKADNVFLIQEINKQDESGLQKSSTFDFTILNNEKRDFEFTATEKDRGGFGAGWLFVKHNRFYQYNQTITVPWTNKELKIEYATYRDKTLPGSEEKWKLRITGYRGEMLAAEMLAGMYDASLDQFYPHSWNAPSVWPTYYNQKTWNATQNFTVIESNQRAFEYGKYKTLVKQYDYLFDESGNRPYPTKDGRVYRSAAPPKNAKGETLEEVVVTAMGQTRQAKELGYSVSKVEDANLANGLAGKVSGLDVDADGIVDIAENEAGGPVQIRKNFNETAFFFPDLRTDSTGAIEFSFTLPEALTRWKFMAIAHTKDLAFGASTKEIVTQKELMVQPNAPRFLREGDRMEFSAKIVNLSDKEFTGMAEFQLVDASTNQTVDGWFHNRAPQQYFTVAAGQSESVKFPIEIPYQFNQALVWRIVAKAGAYSDGEENALPVLTNRMLVTETMALPMRGTGTKDFVFEKLLNAGKSESLQHHALTIEYTSNPVWYAVQALPYLMEYPYECAEQNWNRYYANALASFIANSSPRIKEIFEKWRTLDTAALLSNLQKNQELKSILLEETPWVLQAKNENEQKKNIALLFDLVKMSQEMNNSYEKLKAMQSSNGGFVWFKGGPDDRYITQYIVTGIAHLEKLKGSSALQDPKLGAILNTALPYLDKKIKQDYDELVKNKADLQKYTPGYTQIQYLYMRSFFTDVNIPKESQTAYNYFRTRAQKTWTSQSKYMQGMISLALNRTGDQKTATAILASLKETSINNEELGMYWKDQTIGGWFWYQSPIEMQALMIEAFQEVGKDTKTVDDLRTWLLKNKQTNNWRTTKATAEACYALLLQGTSWLANDPVVEIKLGSTVVRSTDNNQEAGTGYFKKTIEGNKVKPEMGNISVNVSTANGQSSATWGGVYWQYFEDLDKISTAATPLKLAKKLFVETNTDRGPVLKPVNDGDILKIGDKIKVRVELRVDRDMEYVHMKDMRASALEPVNVLSSYKYQGGLGYYESTKDASTNFFFSYLRRGTYVFEYSLFVTHAGNFSNGITTIQCMYAPEFSSHSEGVRISVEEN